MGVRYVCAFCAGFWITRLGIDMDRPCVEKMDLNKELDIYRGWPRGSVMAMS